MHKTVKTCKLLIEIIQLPFELPKRVHELDTAVTNLEEFLARDYLLQGNLARRELRKKDYLGEERRKR